MTPHFDKLYELLMEMPDENVHYPKRSFMDDEEEMDERFHELYYHEKPYDKFEEFLVYYRKTLSNMHEYNFIDVDKKKYAAQVIVDAKMTTDSIWKCKEHRKNLMQDIFLNYFLPHMPYIQSTNMQSAQAVAFWKRVINFALTDNYRCSYIELDTNEEYVFVDNADFESLLDFIWTNSNVILRIYTKQK
jgi:hypothetical protein